MQGKAECFGAPLQVAHDTLAIVVLANAPISAGELLRSSGWPP